MKVDLCWLCADVLLFEDDGLCASCEWRLEREPAAGEKPLSWYSRGMQGNALTEATREAMRHEEQRLMEVVLEHFKDHEPDSAEAAARAFVVRAMAMWTEIEYRLRGVLT